MAIKFYKFKYGVSENKYFWGVVILVNIKDESGLTFELLMNQMKKFEVLFYCYFHIHWKKINWHH